MQENINIKSTPFITMPTYMYIPMYTYVNNSLHASYVIYIHFLTCVDLYYDLNEIFLRLK